MTDTIPVTESLVLEPLVQTHAEALYQLVNTNRQHLRKWLPWVDRMVSEEQFKQFTEEAEKRSAGDQDYPYIILHHGEMAGRIGMYNINRQNQCGSIGYWLGENFLGKGIVQQSCKAFINYAFINWNLNRIEIRCGTENHKSRAVPDKLGFLLEGVIRQAEFVNNHFIDLYCFSMLKEDWVQLPG